MKKTITICAGLLMAASGFSQTQIGQDIDGEAVDDQSGYSVSMPDANTLAIGAPSNDGYAGHVRVYSWNGSTWIQKGADIDGEAADDQSGYSVSMPDANTVAIGAIYNGGNGPNAGHTRIYEWSGTAWVQKGADIDGEAAGDESGYSVSMPDANTVAIGASRNDGNGSESGHVRVCEWNGTAWIQKGVDIDGEAAGDYSGRFVSMPNANTVAIGASRNDGNGSESGHVRVCEWNGTAWIQKGVDIDGEAAYDYSGWSVSMPDANTVAVGALGNSSYTGHARIYEWSGTAWIQKGIDIDGEAADDESGWSVSMPDANTVAIGARLNDGNGSGAGHTRIYEWSGTAWVQKGVDMDGEAADDESGYSVSMPDANTVAIGAIYNGGNGSESGHVRVYNLCNPDVTTSTSGITITANNASATYVWLDCDNNFAPISGETGQSFTPTANGNYAVQITENGCIDTSACVAISNVGIEENDLESMGIHVFPNPTQDGNVVITFDESQKNCKITLFSALGAVLETKRMVNSDYINFKIDGSSGVYFLELEVDSHKYIIRLVKN